MSKILFIGDIVGKGGRAITDAVLPELKARYQPDLVIANAENAAHGNGLTRSIYFALTDDLKIDALTSGNHIWDNKDIFEDTSVFRRLVRPVNFPPGVPLNDHLIIERNQKKIGIFNLMGRVFMNGYDDPFRAADQMIETLRAAGCTDIILDFHAEATSEKAALAWYLDGRISALIGTHTHVQTADERLLPSGTAFITDAGFTGGWNSIIGMKKEKIIPRFLTMLPSKFEPEETGPMQFNGVFLETNEQGKAVRIERIHLTRK